MTARPWIRRGLRALALVGGYVGVMVWLTWPLAASIGSSLPKVLVGGWRFDLFYSTWVMAHGSHALTSAQASFADANIYYPAADALFYGPAGLGALPLFAPVFLASGNPVLATNLTLILGLALTGVSMHVVVRRWTGSDLAGAVAAATVIVNQWLVRGFVPTAPHWAALFWLPLIAFVAATHLDSLRWSLALALLLVLQCLTDLVYVTPAVMGPLGILVALRLLRHSTRAAGLRLAAALVLACLALAPLYYGYVTVQAANPDIAQQTRWTHTEAASPSVLPDQWWHGYAPFLLTPVALGLIAIGALALLLRRRAGLNTPLPGAWQTGALWTIVGACLALNPTVTVAGYLFPSPLGLGAEWVASLNAIRVPARLGIAGLIGLGILSGAAFAEIERWIRTRLPSKTAARAVCGVLAAVVLSLVYRAYCGNYWTWKGVGAMPAEYMLQPAPPAIPASFLPILRASHEPLLELPVTLGTEDPHLHALAMFRSTAHWRPLLNGYSSYWPAGFNQRMKEVRRLPGRDALESLVAETGVALIWVHRRDLGPEERAAWDWPPVSGDGHVGLILVAREGPEMLFAVDPPPVPVPRKAPR